MQFKEAMLHGRYLTVLKPFAQRWTWGVAQAWEGTNQEQRYLVYLELSIEEKN